MSTSKKAVAAIEGWFTMDEASPRLLGTRCKKCGTYFFPREQTFCRNPGCTGSEFEEVKLSDRGTLWSFTNNCYQPPAPYVSPDPFEPYAVAAVELANEKMVRPGGEGIPSCGPQSHQFIDATRIIHYTLQKPWMDFTVTGGSAVWWNKFFRVHPEDAGAVRRAEPSLRGLLRHPGALEFREDPVVGRGGAVVETESEGVDARLQAQLELLLRALEEAVAP